MEAKGGKGGLEVGQTGFNVGLNKQFVPFWNGLMHLIGVVNNDVITMRYDWHNIIRECEQFEKDYLNTQGFCESCVFYEMPSFLRGVMRDADAKGITDCKAIAADNDIVYTYCVERQRTRRWLRLAIVVLVVVATGMTAEDCPICVESFSVRKRRPVSCKHCGMRACHACVATFLLGRESAACMGCQKPWDYDFLCMSMSHSFVRGVYKEHVKEILVAEAERGLAEFQEVAALLNEKETIRTRLDQVVRQLDGLDENLARLVETEVVLGEKRFRLWVDVGGVEEVLRGTFILRHVQGLVSPPPTAEDLAMEEVAIRGLEKEQRHLRVMHLFAVLDVNVFYTDKVLIALAADMRNVRPTPEEIRDSVDKAREAKERHDALHARKKELYDVCVRGGELEPLIVLAEECRQASRTFWKHLFRAKPPTREDFARIEADKERYSAKLLHYKEKMRQNQLDLASVRGAFLSGVRYYYNLDDHLLYPVPGSDANDAEAVVVLAAEEERSQAARRALTDGVESLAPVYEGLREELKRVAKDVRRVTRGRIGGGHYDADCPRTGCPGKLVGWACGLCGHACCGECLVEKEEGHACRKEDVMTARELRRNTRPCPKCRALIYKVEGCDQMWCVRCHTAFSWKTGALAHGVIHNPHFYDYRRRDNGSAPRAPGDVPCGGMPNEIEILTAAQKNDDTLIIEIWEYCLWLTETKMPSVYRRFHNTRTLRERRYGIAYLRGKVDRKRFKTLLYSGRMDELRYADYYAILEMLIDNMAEHMRRYVAGENTLVECRALLRIADQDVRTLNERYGTRMEGIRWFF